MEKLVTFILIIVSFMVNGQKRELQSISVTGKSSLTVKPDIGILKIHLSVLKPQMGEAIKGIADKSKYYHELLLNLGFSEKDMKTTNFSVSQNRIYKNNESVDSGYVANQNIRLNFKYEQRTLQRIVTEFSANDKSIDFNIEFELSDDLRNKIKSQLIELAVKDAQEVAYLIAKSIGIKLGGIFEIRYGNNGLEGIHDTYNQRFDIAPKSLSTGEDLMFINFTPDDLIFRDDLMVIWKIN